MSGIIKFTNFVAIVTNVTATSDAYVWDCITCIYDYYCSRNKNSRTYFYTTFGAYVFGLAATIFVMHVFKAAQVGTLDFLSLSIFSGGTFTFLCGVYVDFVS